MADERIEKIEIEEGFTVEVIAAEISEGVRLEIYDNADATLIVGGNEIDFAWTLKAAAMFENLTPDQLALLAVLAE